MYLEVQQAAPDQTPLILELSNDAVHTTALNDGTYFDMENLTAASPSANAILIFEDGRLLIPQKNLMHLQILA
jgi:hypothetical protein